MKTHGITRGRALSALAIACSLSLGAAFAAQPAAAQTAKKLNCNGCVKSKQLKNGGIKSQDIKDGQVRNADLGDNAVTGGKIADGAIDSADLARSSVNSATVTNNALTAGDLRDEAGVAPLNDPAEPRSIDLTTDWSVMEVITLTAPTSGAVTCLAAGFADADVAKIRMIVRVGWDTVGGDSPPVSSNVAIGETFNGNLTMPMIAMHSFQVPAGTTEFNLKARCQECQAGDADYGFHSAACTFYPTVY